MRIRVLLLLLSLLACMVSARADGWLITPLEAHREAERMAEGLVFRGRSTPVPDAPRIVRVKPGEGEVTSPFDIVFTFSPQDGAVIDPKSFRVLYGFFRMDITNRVAQQANISVGGVTISRANIPAGKHHLVLNVTDSKQRTGEAEFEIEVK
jgi:hypothetical protein